MNIELEYSAINEVKVPEVRERDKGTEQDCTDPMIH